MVIAAPRRYHGNHWKEACLELLGGTSQGAISGAIRRGPTNAARLLHDDDGPPTPGTFAPATEAAPCAWRQAATTRHGRRSMLISHSLQDQQDTIPWQNCSGAQVPAIR